MKLHVVRASIEISTPFLIGAGHGSDVTDQVFVTDASGLPAIPGSSIAGVLRDAYTRRHLSTASSELPTPEILFGSSGGGTASEESSGSALTVSWACIHDSHDRAVEGLRQPREDEVAAFACEGVLRHHVRLSHRGTAEHRGKFDEVQVAAGHRFSFELSVEDTDGSMAAGLDEILVLLRSGELSFGRGRGRGMGRFQVIRMGRRCFDLGHSDGYRDLAAMGVDLQDLHGFEMVDCATPITPRTVSRIRIPLSARSLWLVASGERGDDADMFPLSEPYVTWKADRGKVMPPRQVLPGSSLRGALRHRVAFHVNRFNGHFADGKEPEELARLSGEENEAVRALFGAKGDRAGGGTVGVVRVADVPLADGDLTTLHHVGLDRFTGGALEGVLFKEQARDKDSFVATLEIDLSRGPIPETARTALDAALQDLEQGMLSIGSGYGRGNGRFEIKKDASRETSGSPWPGKQARKGSNEQA